MRLRKAASFALAAILTSGLLLTAGGSSAQAEGPPPLLLPTDVYTFGFGVEPLAPWMARIHATFTNNAGEPATLNDVSALLEVTAGLIEGINPTPLAQLGDGASLNFSWTVTGCSVDSFFDIFVDFAENLEPAHKFGPFSFCPTFHHLHVGIVGNGGVVDIGPPPVGLRGTKIDCSTSGAVDCDEDYLAGTPVHLEPQPGPGWQFLYWEGGPCDPPSDLHPDDCDMFMDSPKSVVAHFDEAAAPTCPPDCDAPPDEVTVESDFEGPGGLPVIFRDEDTTFSKDVTDHCAAASPLAVKLVLTPEFGATDEVMLTNTGGENWSASFTPAGHGLTPLTFYVDCPLDTPGFPEDTGAIDDEDEIQDGGAIFIDPSGTVVDDCTGAPLGGATVRLLKLVSGDFVTPLATEHIPAINPQFTGPTGAYGWLVVSGTWKLHVEKSGYTSTDSDPLIIPPAVTGLIIPLTPTAGCEVDVDASLASLQALEDDIDATTDVSRSLRHQLTTKIDEVQKALAKHHPKEKQYCHKLDDFLKKLEHKTGKDGLTASQAAEWRDWANTIGAALGCP